MTDLERPTFTPDGTQILHRNHLKNRESIYSYSVVDGSVQALPGVFPGNFSLSPDGKWIATIGGYRRPGDNHGNEMRLHPAVGGDGDVLWTTDESERFGRWTTWTPDGTALLVLKQEPQAGEDMWRLWVVPVDGSDPVATELVYERAARVDIHPDGKRIVYAAGRYFNQFWALSNLALDQPDSP
jgi:Tol biopolymer transport system component